MLNGYSRLQTFAETVERIACIIVAHRAPWLRVEGERSQVKKFVSGVFISRRLLLNLMLIALWSVALSSQASQDDPQSGIYIGLGLSRLSIKSEHPSISDQSIIGVSLLFGVSYDKHVFELSIAGGEGVDVGPTPDIYYPEDSADYGAITLSYQYHWRDVGMLENISPYLGIGYSYNSFNWNNYVYDQSGDGLTLIAGLIFPIDKNWNINFTLRRYSFSGERILFTYGDYPNYDSEINELAGIVEYHF